MEEPNYAEMTAQAGQVRERPSKCPAWLVVGSLMVLGLVITTLTWVFTHRNLNIPIPK